MAPVMVFGLLFLYYSVPVDQSAHLNSKQIILPAIEPRIDSGLASMGMQETSSHTFKLSKDGNKVTLMISSLYAIKDNATGYVITVLVNSYVSGSIIERVHQDQNGTNFTLIPVYSAIMKNAENFRLNNSPSIGGNISSHLSSSPAIATPVAQIFPEGTYTSSMYGWAYSWNNYNTQGLEK